jgi:tRNA A22 N-methylase
MDEILINSPDSVILQHAENLRSWESINELRTKAERLKKDESLITKLLRMEIRIWYKYEKSW